MTIYQHYGLEIHRPDWATSGPLIDYQDFYTSREEAQDAAVELRKQGLQVDGPFRTNPGN